MWCIKDHIDNTEKPGHGPLSDDLCYDHTPEVQDSYQYSSVPSKRPWKKPVRCQRLVTEESGMQGSDLT